MAHKIGNRSLESSLRDAPPPYTENAEVKAVEEKLQTIDLTSEDLQSDSEQVEDRGLNLTDTELDTASTDAFHLNIEDYTYGYLANNPASARRYQRKIDDFLEDLFITRYEEQNETVPPDYECPFRYSTHQVSSSVGTDVRAVIKIAFKLSRTTTKTFNEVATEFCERVCSKPGQALLTNLSHASLFGLSPIRGTAFARIWNSVFYLRILTSRGQILQQLLDNALSTTNVPWWLATGSYAVSMTSGFNVGSWAARTLTNHVGAKTISELALNATAMNAASMTAAGIVMVTCGRAFLQIRAQKRAGKRADSEFAALGWKAKMENFIRVTDSVLRKLTEVQTSNSAGRRHHQELADLLLKVIDEASDLFTTNQKAFELYDELRKDMEKRVGIGAGIASAYAGATVVFASMSVTLVPTLTLVPMAAAEMGALTAAAVSLGIIEAPLVAQAGVAAMFTPLAPLAIAAFIGAAIMTGVTISSAIDKRKYKKRVNCFVSVSNTVIGIWRLADDTYTLLAWINCMDRATPVFNSNADKQKWEEFILRVRKSSNALPTAEDYTGQGLKNYLGERTRDLIKLKADLEKECEVFK